MKCNEVRKQIDLQLTGGLQDLEKPFQEHIEICDGCREYYGQAVRMAELLNKQEFEVYPGELDDITFEKIVAAPVPKTKKAGYLRNIFSVRWAWIPAAAAIFILFALFPKTVNYDLENGTIQLIDWNSQFSNSIPEGLDSTAFSYINVNDNDLELLEEELLYNSDIDNLIESLTDEEFNVLYEKIKSKSGSTG